MNWKINIVDDEKQISDLLQAYLTKEGYQVTVYNHFTKAQSHCHDHVHLWLLDIMLDSNSGYELLSDIKKHYPTMPIIFISARDQEFDRILGLEKGCDDYIVKPFNIQEVILRVQNILKRTYPKQDSYQIDKYLVDVNKRKVFLEDQEIILTTKEFELLEYFINNKNLAISREQVLSNVWDENYYGSDRVVDDTLRRLRKKLPKLNIQTIYGFGYRLD